MICSVVDVCVFEGTSVANVLAWLRHGGGEESGLEASTAQVDRRLYGIADSKATRSRLIVATLIMPVADDLLRWARESNMLSKLGVQRLEIPTRHGLLIIDIPRHLSASWI